MNLIEIDPHAQAILDLLDTVTMPNGQPLAIGDGEAPPSSNPQGVVLPCAVLHLRPGGRVSGGLGEVNTDVLLRFQVTCVGAVARQARAVADWVTGAIEGAQPVIEGRHVQACGRPPNAGPIGAAQRDPDITPSVFYVPVEFRLWTCPLEESS